MSIRFQGQSNLSGSLVGSEGNRLRSCCSFVESFWNIITKRIIIPSIGMLQKSNSQTGRRNHQDLNQVISLDFKYRDHHHNKYAMRLIIPSPGENNKSNRQSERWNIQDLYQFFISVPDEANLLLHRLLKGRFYSST